MIKKNNFLTNSIIYIFIISFIFSFLHGQGFYGYGNDYYAIYYENNLNFGSMFNRLGWIISTFTLNNIHLGVHMTSFILSLSFGYLLRSIFKTKNIYDLLYFLLIMIIGIHTWPIIMSTSNGMRQGLCMSMIFLTIAYNFEKNFFLSFAFLFLALFMHKSGPYIVMIYLFSFFAKYYADKLFNFKNIFYAFSTITIFIISLLILIFFEDGERQSRIIFKDYRYHFAIIGILYSIGFWYLGKILQKDILHIFVYHYIIATYSVLYLQYNYEYERLLMVILIPIIFSVGLILNKRSFYLYCLPIFLSLLGLTIYNGMYNSFS